MESLTELVQLEVQGLGLTEYHLHGGSTFISSSPYLRCETEAWRGSGFRLTSRVPSCPLLGLGMSAGGWKAGGGGWQPKPRGAALKHIELKWPKIHETIP